MKCVFTLGSPVIGGGTNVIFEHASSLAKAGEDVYIVTENKVEPEEYAWHTDAHLLKWTTYDTLEESNEEFDLCIFTWWKTVYEGYRINAKKYLYFVQSIESKFYPDYEQGVKMLAELTYCLDFTIITEATWIKEYLTSKYGLDVELVHNGIRKDLFTLEGETVDMDKKKGLRVLVEGPTDVDFKNVPKTIDLVKQSDADEIWLLTSTEVKDYKGVDKVFSRVPMFDVHSIYRSCDVIVKLSYIEGMFGPPLETFHTGGTAIVYDVTGHDEYIVHEKNGLVVKTDDDEKVIEYINKLKDEKYLNKLKKGALKTASEWISWEESSKLFHKAVKKQMKKPTINRETLKHQSKFYFDIYVKYETKQDSIKKVVGRSLRTRTPKIYKILLKIRKR